MPVNSVETAFECRRWNVGESISASGGFGGLNHHNILLN